jgi:CRISPR/Cas system CSM-associated protein Csm2 small subunit
VLTPCRLALTPCRHRSDKNHIYAAKELSDKNRINAAKEFENLHCKQLRKLYLQTEKVKKKMLQAINQISL